MITSGGVVPHKATDKVGGSLLFSKFETLSLGVAKIQTITQPFQKIWMIFGWDSFFIQQGFEFSI